ncbi:MAG: phosphoglucosamine mutase [Lentisphaeraceae bacterium]|nr:phosphoglucosamine mutase [Lentisphaeraceae bacterium]
MSKAIDNLKISISGVRGVVGETLTPRLISTFSAAFGQYVGQGPVIISRDTRPSGLMVEQAVIAGLLSVGCQPILAGVIPTPTLQIAVDELNASGGIAITASHNPLPWNALKFVNDKGMFLNSTEAGEVLDIYNQENTHHVVEESLKSIKTLENAFDFHLQRILEVINVASIKKQKLRVAIDCGSGAGAPFTEDFIKRLGCEVFAINTNSDGTFNRKLEPTPEALSELCKLVKKEKCDVGFAQDPDADRLVIIDEKGQALNENYSLALTTIQVLSKKKGPVTASLATSKLVSEVCKLKKTSLKLTKIGEINVSTEMLKNKSVIGGEANGGVIWPAVHPCRDSYSGMALILELLRKEKSISNIVDSLPKYHFGSAKIASSSEKAHYAVSKLKTLFAKENPLLDDGIRIDWEDKWVIIRPSNTEPLLRIQAEADSKQKLTALLKKFEKLCSDFINS